MGLTIHLVTNAGGGSIWIFPEILALFSGENMVVIGRSFQHEKWPILHMLVLPLLCTPLAFYFLCPLDNSLTQKTSPLLPRSARRHVCELWRHTTPLFHEGLKNYPWSHPRVINPNRVRGGSGSLCTVPNIVNSNHMWIVWENLESLTLVFGNVMNEVL